MIRSLARAVSAALLLVLPLAGCAGGWRNGVPPAGAVAATPAAVAPAAPAKAATDATHGTADAAVFVWKGGGNTVNVAGEFNSWSTSADAMTRQADGSFTLTKPLAAGRYAYKFVVNGTDWKADPDAKETVDDGYGGKNAIVVVGAAAAAAAPAAAPKAAAAPAASGAGTHETKDGVLFVWKGGGGSVSVAGEFNSWNTSADAMTKQADGSFTLLKPLQPGRYAYKFVVDGTNWKEDPTAKETVDDGYGGKNAVIVVSGAATGTAAAAPAAPAAPVASPAAGGAGTHETKDGVLFVWKGGGNTVNVAGEFNSWNTSADAMTKQADGSFTLLKPLAPGRYAYKFVVDGGNWKEDPTAKETVDDGYGGKNAVIVVSGAATGAPAAATPAAPTAVTGKGKAPVVAGGSVTFTYAGPASKSVHLAGDFNEWSTTADPMTRQSDGTWTLTRKVAPGTYTYKFVVDGTTWKTDEANPATRDDGFGGKNSVVTVK